MNNWQDFDIKRKLKPSTLQKYNFYTNLASDLEEKSPVTTVTFVVIAFYIFFVQGLLLTNFTVNLLQVKIVV